MVVATGFHAAMLGPAPGDAIADAARNAAP
jgi:hypothetical protein